MKFQVERDALLRTVTRVARVVPTRTPSPILMNLLINVDDSVTITATDHVMMVEDAVEGCTILEQGQITAPARLLHQAVAAMQGEITVELKGSKIAVSNENSKVSLNTLSPEDLILLDTEGDFVATIPGDDFVPALSQVMFSASKDDSRPVLAGIYVFAEEGKLTFVSGDGFRVSTRELFCNVGEWNGVVLPSSALRTFLPLFSGDVDIWARGNHVVFVSESTVCVTQIVNAEYPKIVSFLDQSWDTKVETDKDGLLAALRVAILINPSFVSLDIQTDNINISSTGAQTGESNVDIPAEVVGPDLKFVINGEYLAEAVSEIEASRVSMESSSELQIVKLSDNGFQHGLMKMRMPE
jgi:DNA polymerase III subunit beta